MVSMPPPRMLRRRPRRMPAAPGRMQPGALPRGARAMPQRAAILPHTARGIRTRGAAGMRMAQPQSFWMSLPIIGVIMGLFAGLIARVFPSEPTRGQGRISRWLQDRGMVQYQQPTPRDWRATLRTARGQPLRGVPRQPVTVVKGHQAYRRGLPHGVLKAKKSA